MHSIEWAAGLFEGEGYLDERAHAIHIQMTDRDVMEKFAEVLDYGEVRSYPAKPNRKALHRYHISRKSEVQRILSAMLPYLGNRRAYKALNILDDLELA